MPCHDRVARETEIAVRDFDLQGASVHLGSFCGASSQQTVDQISARREQDQRRIGNRFGNAATVDDGLAGESMRLPCMQEFLIALERVHVTRQTPMLGIHVPHVHVRQTTGFMSHSSVALLRRLQDESVVVDPRRR